MARFRKILVPIDFSSHSDAALGLAIELARESGGAVHLLHAYELPAAVSVAYGIAIPQSVWDGMQEAATQRLEECLGRVRAAGLAGTTQLATGPAARWAAPGRPAARTRPKHSSRRCLAASWTPSHTACGMAMP